MNRIAKYLEAIRIEPTDASDYFNKVEHIYIYMRAQEYYFNHTLSAPYNSLVGCLLELADKNHNEIRLRLNEFSDTLQMIISKFCKQIKQAEMIANAEKSQLYPSLN